MSNVSAQVNLLALKESIKKWEQIVAGTGQDEGSQNCALCFLYYKSACLGCPVRERSGGLFCAKTPYVAWRQHHKNVHYKVEFPLKVECPECRRLAARELGFLCSLLPDEQTTEEKSK